MTEIIHVDTAFILCGGLGTRLKPFTNSLPKPMMDCNGKPFLYYIMAQLARQGIEKFILGTGYLKEKIRDYFGDGESFGWATQYSEGDNDWDTGRRLWEAKHILPEHFLLLYGDNFTNFDMQLSLESYSAGADLTFLVTEKERGEYKTNGNIKMTNDGIVQEYSKSPDGTGFDHVEIGYMLAKKDALLSAFDDINCNLSTVLTRLTRSGMANAVIAQQPYFWITDVASWKDAEAYISELSWS